MNTSCQIPNHMNMKKFIYVGIDDEEYCMSCLTIQRPCPFCRENQNDIVRLEVSWESRLNETKI